MSSADRGGWAGALQGAALVPVLCGGHVRLTGADALDVLHRLGTNDLRGLAVGDVRATVLATPKGRLVDVVRVARPDDLLVLTSPGGAAAVTAHLERFIVSEDAAVGSVGADWECWRVAGPAAGDVWASALGPLPPPGRCGRLAGALALGDLLEGAGDGVLHGPPESVRPLVERLVAAGAVRLDVVAAEAWRIVAGRPAFASEMHEDWNPLEAGFGPAISFSKGCYVGQEVIARLHYYEKQRRQLVRLLLGGDPGPRPLTLRWREAACGTLTSAAQVPGGSWVGLGFVDMAASNRGTVCAAGPTTAEVFARVGADPVAPPPPGARRT